MPGLLGCKPRAWLLIAALGAPLLLLLLPCPLAAGRVLPLVEVDCTAHNAILTPFMPRIISYTAGANITQPPGRKKTVTGTLCVGVRLAADCAKSREQHYCCAMDVRKFEMQISRQAKGRPLSITSATLDGQAAEYERVRSEGGKDKWAFTVWGPAGPAPRKPRTQVAVCMTLTAEPGDLPNHVEGFCSLPGPTGTCKYVVTNDDNTCCPFGAMQDYAQVG